MKSTTFLFVSALLATFLLSACGEKAEEAPAVEAPAAEVAPVESAPAPEPAPVAGGYEPTAEERVPGITISPEELAASVEAAEAAPTETAPEEGS